MGTYALFKVLAVVLASRNTESDGMIADAFVFLVPCSKSKQRLIQRAIKGTPAQARNAVIVLAHIKGKEAVCKEIFEVRDFRFSAD
ncbi:hypothetical protein BC936DRAFT_141240 [Jimgerdemannia flammicorona]|uniref:Uncharacterized protein n=1 Tax=Jimgerdemannia flammicorona TaxID=994334 RepID=A0A433A2M9_9FUNG|nr:hypothetical protein BC936DRAFT_141240 [Jimgerdemannia flammicorona]